MAMCFQQTTWGTRSHSARYQLKHGTGNLCYTLVGEGAKPLNQKCFTAEEIPQHILTNEKLLRTRSFVILPHPALKPFTVFLELQDQKALIMLIPLLPWDEQDWNSHLLRAMRPNFSWRWCIYKVSLPPVLLGIQYNTYICTSFPN